MADSDLPVFSFRPNWREPMPERLAFLTDVQAATEGAEQRRSLRSTPRRTFDADFLLTGPERTFWDLFINRLGGGEVVAPLYWEVVRLTSPLTATVTDRIDFDTSYREWQYHEGRLAILMGKTALDYEVVEIAAVDAGGVDLVSPVTRPWPMGTSLLPLRRASLEQVGDLDHKTAGVATVTAQLRVVGPNPWTPAEDDSVVYAGLPVMLSEPNWVDDLATSMRREMALLDTEVGLTYQVDTVGRAFLGQAHRWFLTGRQRLAGFRDLVYRHRGRAGAFWLPTFKADLRLANSPGSGATQIEVENVGYLYTGGPTSGREYIAIKHTGGTIFRKVLSVIPGTTSKTEKLNLDAPLGLALSPGLVRRISFMDTARFDTDEFEITHFGGIDAHHEANATLRTFKNTRTAPLPISAPIAGGVMNSVPCGIQVATGVLNIDANDFTLENRNGGGIVLRTDDPEAVLTLLKVRASESNGTLLYDAYSLWPTDDRNRGRTWQNQFYVWGGFADDEIDNLLSSAGTLVAPGGFFFFETQEDAFQGLVDYLPLSFSGFTHYRITCTVDSNLGDNRGGISLQAIITSEGIGA
jgi:hypothetical protein